MLVLLLPVTIATVAQAEYDPDSTEVIISEGEYNGNDLITSHRLSEQYHGLLVETPWTVTFINKASYVDNIDNGVKRKIELFMYVNDNKQLKHSAIYENVPFECSKTMDMDELVTEAGGNPEQFTIKTQYVLSYWENDDWQPLGDSTRIEYAYVAKITGPW